MPNLDRDVMFTRIWSKAKEAGVRAGSKPQNWFPCGFTWIKCTPGNSAFASWMKKNEVGRKAWDVGVDHWIGEHGQNMKCKIAHAEAMMEVLITHCQELGVARFSIGSRPD